MASHTILKRDPIFKGRVIDLGIETVRLPDGTTNRREVIRHDGAVAILPLHPDGRVTLVRQYRVPAGQDMLEVPAGLLEAGEDPRACASRELQEEVGLRPGRLEPLGGFFLAPGYSSEYIHLFLATDLVPAALEGDDDEFIEVLTLPFAEALALVEQGAINNSTTVTALLLLAEHFPDL
ncbi:MAG: NUDIX hydrolase [Anaerolineae bacterium]|nr:NUDIX hydrolase [Anaerolineae bacterium]